MNRVAAGIPAASSIDGPSPILSAHEVTETGNRWQRPRWDICPGFCKRARAIAPAGAKQSHRDPQTTRAQRAAPPRKQARGRRPEGSGAGGRAAAAPAAGSATRQRQDKPPASWTARPAGPTRAGRRGREEPHTAGRAGRISARPQARKPRAQSAQGLPARAAEGPPRRSAEPRNPHISGVGPANIAGRENSCAKAGYFAKQIDQVKDTGADR